MHSSIQLSRLSLIGFGFVSTRLPTSLIGNKNSNFKRYLLPDNKFSTKKNGDFSSNLTGVCNYRLSSQIHKELGAAHVYFEMAAWFQRPEVGLKGFARYFRHNFWEEMRHADKFSRYQSMRGGIFTLSSFEKPPDERKFKSGGAIGALEDAIELEEDMYKNLLLLRKLAEEGDWRDVHMAEFLLKYIMHQVEDISEKKSLLTNLNRAGEKEGLCYIDAKLLSRKWKKY